MPSSVRRPVATPRQVLVASVRSESLKLLHVQLQNKFEHICEDIDTSTMEELKEQSEVTHQLLVDSPEA